jgi:hypothetical protein
MESEVNDYINVYLETARIYNDAIQSAAITRGENAEAIGFRTVTHVFQFTYAKSKCLATAFDSSKQAIIFYIEYAEQISRSNQSDFNDAVVFVYNKMLSKPKYYPIARISKSIYTLFWWDNPSIDRQSISRDLIAGLSRYEFISTYLEIAQQRQMDTQTYIEFLTETYKILKKNGEMPDSNEWTIRYVAKRPEWDESLKLPIKKWCKWLLI